MAVPADERAAAIEAAADLLALAMSESHGPVDVLGRAFERMARAIGECSRAIELQGTIGKDASPLADFNACREVLEKQLAACIESLQFHDLLMQRLSHVSARLTNLIDASSPPEKPRQPNLSEGSIELF